MCQVEHLCTLHDNCQYQSGFNECCYMQQCDYKIKVNKTMEKRPIIFEVKRQMKPLEERKDLKGDDLFNITTKTGTFHQWASDYEEDENKIAEFTIGICEDEEGCVHEVRPSRIKFTDK